MPLFLVANSQMLAVMVVFKQLFRHRGSANKIWFAKGFRNILGGPKGSALRKKLRNTALYHHCSEACKYLFGYWTCWSDMVQPKVITLKGTSIRIKNSVLTPYFQIILLLLKHSYVNYKDLYRKLSYFFVITYKTSVHHHWQT